MFINFWNFESKIYFLYSSYFCFSTGGRRAELLTPQYKDLLFFGLSHMTYNSYVILKYMVE